MPSVTSSDICTVEEAIDAMIQLEDQNRTLKARIAELAAALRRIADQDFDGPSHLEGACAAEIAEKALQSRKT